MELIYVKIFTPLFFFIVGVLLAQYYRFKPKYRIKHIEGVGYWAQVRFKFLAVGKR